MTTLSNYWHPIAVDRGVTDPPQRCTLLATDLVAFLRDELHLNIPDASGIAYHKLLGGIRDVEAFLP